jgi:hypothetical protein
MDKDLKDIIKTAVVFIVIVIIYALLIFKYKFS